MINRKEIHSIAVTLLIALLLVACKQRKGSSTETKAVTVVTDPSKLTVVIHPGYVVIGSDTLFSQSDSARLQYIGVKVSKLDSLRKIKLKVPYPPDTAVVMPVVRILKPTGAQILITPYDVK
jgi:hypothetical protein